MQSESVTIRPVGQQDVGVLADLLLQANRHYWGRRDEAVPMTRAAAERIVDGRSGCQALVAWIDGVPSAFATVSILHPGLSEHGTLFMKDLYVVDGARGSGLGKTMMRYLATLAVSLGCRRFDWTAEEDNPGALRFYDAFGATRVEDKVYYRLTGTELTDRAAPVGPKEDDGGR